MTLRIALCTAHPFPPQLIGGAQRSMQQLGSILASIGHEVCFFTGLSGKGWLALQARLIFKTRQRSIIKSELEGFPVFRAWHPFDNIDEFINLFHPQVAICFSGLPVPFATSFKDRNVPSIIYFRNVETNDFGGDPKGVADRYISNSHFTAEFVKLRFGVDSCVIPPLIIPEKYRTTRGNKVTFINPHAEKGRHIVYELVRKMPHIPFLIVKAWTLDAQSSAELYQLAKDCQNLTVIEATNDMRAIYAQTKILLAPSQWEEAWGRVATEAQFSGIPVIASDAGGLPEAVGPGGMVLHKHAPIGDWKAALDKMWSNENVYREFCEKAASHGRRHEIQKEFIIERLDEQIQLLLINKGSA